MKTLLIIFVSLVIVALGIILVGTVKDRPNENSCREYVFNEMVYVTKGFYKGYTGIVTSVEWMKWPSCNRSYNILIIDGMTTVQAKVKVDEIRLQDVK